MGRRFNGVFGDGDGEMEARDERQSLSLRGDVTISSRRSATRTATPMACRNCARTGLDGRTPVAGLQVGARVIHTGAQ